MALGVQLWDVWKLRCALSASYPGNLPGHKKLCAKQLGSALLRLLMFASWAGKKQRITGPNACGLVHSPSCIGLG